MGRGTPTCACCAGWGGGGIHTPGGRGACIGSDDADAAPKGDGGADDAVAETADSVHSDESEDAVGGGAADSGAFAAAAATGAVCCVDADFKACATRPAATPTEIIATRIGKTRAILRRGIRGRSPLTGDCVGRRLERPTSSSGVDPAAGSEPELSIAATLRARAPMLVPARRSTQSPTSATGATSTARWIARAISRAVGKRACGLAARPRITMRSSSGGRPGAKWLGGVTLPARMFEYV